MHFIKIGKNWYNLANLCEAIPGHYPNIDKHGHPKEDGLCLFWNCRDEDSQARSFLFGEDVVAFLVCLEGRR